MYFHASTHWSAVCSCIQPFAAAVRAFGLSWSFKSLTDRRQPITPPRRAVLFASRAEPLICLQTEWVTFLLRTVLSAHRTPAPLNVGIQFRHPFTPASQTRSSAITRFQAPLGTAFWWRALEDWCEHLTERRCAMVTRGAAAAEPLLDRWGDLGAAELGWRCRGVWWEG